MSSMQITRSGVRTWATRVFVALAGAIILGVVAQWFIQVATDKGWYANAGHDWDQLVTPLLAFLTSWPLLAIAILSGGVMIGLRLDAYLANRMARRWWENVQAFSIKDAACLLAGIKRSDFEKSDRACALANELRGYVNSGHVPLFLEIEFERAPRDWSDPNTRYEPPYDKKNVGFDAVISKRFVQDIARARKWQLPWPIPPKEDVTTERPLKRPAILAPVNALFVPRRHSGMFAAGAKDASGIEQSEEKE